MQTWWKYGTFYVEELSTVEQKQHPSAVISANETKEGCSWKGGRRNGIGSVWDLLRHLSGIAVRPSYLQGWWAGAGGPHRDPNQNGKVFWIPHWRLKHDFVSNRETRFMIRTLGSSVKNREKLAGVPGWLRRWNMWLLISESRIQAPWWTWN